MQVIFTNIPNDMYFDTVKRFAVGGLPSLYTLINEYLSKKTWPGADLVSSIFDIFTTVSCVRLHLVIHIIKIKTITSAALCSAENL